MRDLSARLPRLIPELDVSVPVGARLRVRGWVEDDWRARPTPERPWPVVLIHGTTVTSGDFEDLTTQLRALGWAVFIPDYGNRATNRIEDSAEQVGAYIDQVLHATGADRVIIVGHSQGGVLARWWMRMLGGARHVRHLICLASPNHGIREAGLLRPLVLTERQAELTTRATETVFGPAGRQQFTGSAFLTALNADGDTEPGVSYTCVATRTDSTVVPADSCFLDGPGVENIWLQDLHPRAVVLHTEMPRSRIVRTLVAETLESLRPTISS